MSLQVRVMNFDARLPRRFVSGICKTRSDLSGGFLPQGWVKDAAPKLTLSTNLVTRVKRSLLAFCGHTVLQHFDESDNFQSTDRFLARAHWQSQHHLALLLGCSRTNGTGLLKNQWIHDYHRLGFSTSHHHRKPITLGLRWGGVSGSQR